METKILLAIVTGSIGLITALVTTFWSYLQQKKLTELKMNLVSEEKMKQDISSWLLEFETKEVNQSFIQLRDFIKVTQLLKDQLREIIKSKDDFIDEELVENLHNIKQTIIQQFSKSVYYFNKSDQDKNAHAIKNLFIEIINTLISQTDTNGELLHDRLNEVTKRQGDLQNEMESELKKLMPKIE